MSFLYILFVFLCDKHPISRIEHCLLNGNIHACQLLITDPRIQKASGKTYEELKEYIN